MDFFENPNNKVLLDQPLITDTTILDDDDEVVAMIKELIEDRIRPAVQEGKVSKSTNMNRTKRKRIKHNN